MTQLTNLDDAVDEPGVEGADDAVDELGVAPPPVPPDPASSPPSGPM